MRLEPISLVISAALLLGVLAAAGVIWLALRDSQMLTHSDGYWFPRPPGYEFPETPLSAHGLAFEPFEATVASATLRGWIVPAPNDAKAWAMIGLHGRGGDRRGGLSLAPLFHDLGAAVVLFDTRETGLSDGSGLGTGLAVREAEDAVAVAAELRARGYRRIGVYGCSLGGSAAIIAGARDERITAVIAESAIADFREYASEVFGAKFRSRGLGLIADWWGHLVVGVTRFRRGLSPVEAPADVIGNITPRPLLLIHAADDGAVMPRHAEKLASHTGQGAELWMLERGGHCGGYKVDPEGYGQRVRAMLEAAQRVDLDSLN